MQETGLLFFFALTSSWNITAKKNGRLDKVGAGEWWSGACFPDRYQRLEVSEWARRAPNLNCTTNLYNVSNLSTMEKLSLLLSIFGESVLTQDILRGEADTIMIRLCKDLQCIPLTLPYLDFDLFASRIKRVILRPLGGWCLFLPINRMIGGPGSWPEVICPGSF